MDTIATLLGGLGLFFVGIRQLAQNMQSLVGPGARRMGTLLTRGRLAASLAGLGLGGLTQSSSAVTVITANMQASGLITVQRALPLLAWANLGTAALVLLATLDVRLAALLLLGVSGISSYFNLDIGSRLRPVFQSMVGLGLMFMGLALLKAGAAPLREMEWLRSLLAATGDAALPAFALGVAVTFVAQSSSTVSMIAITMFNAGVMRFDEAEMAIYGASLGSGFATFLLAGGLTGTTRQLVLYQFAFKALGTLIFVLLHFIEPIIGLPLISALLSHLAVEQDTQLGMLFALMQITTALVMIPLDGPLLRLIARFAPPNPAEALGRPAFLYDGALRDGSSALTLAMREQARLLARIPMLLDAVREGPQNAALPAHALSAASQKVEKTVEEFLAQLIGDAARVGLDRASMAEAVRLGARNRVLRDLRVVVTEFGASAEQAAGAAPIPQLTEALHLLLEQLAEAQDAEDIAMLLALSEDRGPMMRRIREARAGETPPDLLRQATTSFERAVWLARNLLLIDQEAAGAPLEA
jgi:phosphate:Na+ symporter